MRSHHDPLPDEPSTRRMRIRRGGPRTPFPLLPLIAIAAGIGIAYVSQTAHSTQTTYQVNSLALQQQQLLTKAQQLEDEVARLQSSERIVAAAQQLGMRPASTWAYVASEPSQVLPSPTSQLAGSSNDPLQQLVAALDADARAGSSTP